MCLIVSDKSKAMRQRKIKNGKLIYGFKILENDCRKLISPYYRGKPWKVGEVREVKQAARQENIQPHQDVNRGIHYFTTFKQAENNAKYMASNAKYMASNPAVIKLEIKPEDIMAFDGNGEAVARKVKFIEVVSQQT